MKNIFTLIIGFFSIGLMGQSFENAYPDIPLGTISSINIHSSGVGYASQECGYMLKTTDGGDIWFPVDNNVTTNSNFASIYFLNENDPDEMIYRTQYEVVYTNDGFDTYQTLNPGTLGLMNDFLLASDGTWLLTGANVAYSTDEGATWILSDTDDAGGRYLTEHNGAIYTAFRNIFRSTDSGKTFEVVLETDEIIRKVIARGDQLYAPTLSGKIFQSKDDGFTWTDVEAQNFFGSSDNLIFYDDETLIANSSNRINYSTDEGKTWTSVVMPQGVFRTTCIYVDDQKRIFIGGEASQLYRTEQIDNPLSLIYSNNNQLYSIAAHENEVMAVGSSGIIIHSTDAGNTWNPIMTEVDQLEYITYIDGQPFASDGQGNIVKINDDYSTEVVLETGTSISTLFYSPADKLAYATARSKLYKSEDQGDTWYEHYNFEEGTDFYSAKIFTAGNVVLSTGDQVWWSVNGGADFDVLVPTPEGASTILDFYLFDSDQVMLLTSSTVYLTTDGGQTFESKSRPYNGLKLFNGPNNKALCFGTNLSNATLYWADPLTLDFNQNAQSCGSLYRTAYYDDANHTFWACGIGLDIQKVVFDPTSNKEITTDISEINIYPNPATEYITFDKPANTPFTWHIYNIQGQKVHESTGDAVDVQHLVTGLYEVVLQSTQSIYRCRFYKW